jgi:exodeoxyribonuclease VII small subunit
MSRDAQRIKKNAPGMMQRMGRNSAGDFPLKPYPAQRFQGFRPVFISIIRLSFVDPGSGDELFLTSFHTSRRFLPPSPVTKPRSQNPQSFEAALAEIENIVAAMEAGQLPLEQSLTAYKRGAELLHYCQTRLQEAQQQVKILEAGTLKNFDGDDGTD